MIGVVPVAHALRHGFIHPRVRLRKTVEHRSLGGKPREPLLHRVPRTDCIDVVIVIGVVRAQHEDQLDIVLAAQVHECAHRIERRLVELHALGTRRVIFPDARRVTVERRFGVVPRRLGIVAARTDLERRARARKIVANGLDRRPQGVGADEQVQAVAQVLIEILGWMVLPLTEKVIQKQLGHNNAQVRIKFQVLLQVRDVQSQGTCRDRSIVSRREARAVERGRVHRLVNAGGAQDHGPRLVATHFVRLDDAVYVHPPGLECVDPADGNMQRRHAVRIDEKREAEERGTPKEHPKTQRGEVAGGLHAKTGNTGKGSRAKAAAARKQTCPI